MNVTDFRKELSIAAVLLVLSSVLAVGSVFYRTVPLADEASYLSTALWIKENGGVMNFIPLSIKGVYQESNRHPVYLLILSLFVERKPVFFAVAKIVTATLSLIFLTAYYLIVRKRFGFEAALASVCLMLSNVVFIFWTGVVGCEILLMMLMTVAWHYSLKGFEDNRYWALAGLLTGLAYMTKATGLALILPFSVACLVKYGRKVARNRWFYSYFILFLLVSSPLLVRNQVVYANPFYNFSQKVFWADEYIEYTRQDYGYTASFSDYLKTHTPSQMLIREARGLVEVSFNIISQLGFILGPIFALFMASSLLGRNIETRVYVLVLALTFLLFFAWFTPVESDFRYELPLMPILAAYSADGLIKGLRGNSGLMKVIAQISAIYLALIVVVMTAFMAFNVKERYDGGGLMMYEVPGDYKSLLEWLNANLEYGDYVLRQPGMNSYSAYDWTSERVSSARFFTYPYRVGKQPEELLSENNITFFIMTKDLAFDEPAVQDYFGYDKSRGIYEKKGVKGYGVVFRDGTLPTTYLVYRKL